MTTMSNTSKASGSATSDGKENTNPATRTSRRKRPKATNTDSRVEPQAKSGRQSKAGRLSQLMSMPMDILMEVRYPFLSRIWRIYAS